jgi:sugar/nucleoside kinase (ribokinase family)
MAFDDLEYAEPTPDPAGGPPRLRFDNVIGGAATYAALAASLLSRARVVAVVGEDFPAATLELLEARGADTAGVERAPGRTFRWRGRYHAGLARRETLDTQLNVFADFRPKLPAGWHETPLVLLGNIHPALQLEVVERMHAPELVVADTMNYWIHGEPELLARLLAGVGALVVNDEEARELSGIDNLSRAARDILARGPARLVVKRGEDGATLFDAEGVFLAPAMPLADVCDPTGAGDSFAGGALGHLATEPRLDHAAWRRALLYGAATGAYCVQAVGTAMLERIGASDVEARVSQLRKLIEVD